MIEWYHLYINHRGGSRLAKIIRRVCYWKCLATQEKLYARLCKVCKLFKNRKTFYLYLSPKIIAELKPLNSVHVYMIGTYSMFISQHQPGGAIIKDNVIITCMTMIDPYAIWFEIVEVPTY